MMMVMVMVNESTDLQTVNQLIKKYKKDPSYRLKSKISIFTVIQWKTSRWYEMRFWREEREPNRCRDSFRRGEEDWDLRPHLKEKNPLEARWKVRF